MINKNKLTYLIQTMSLGTFLLGVTMADGARKKYPEVIKIEKYPDVINENAQAEKCISSAQAYLKKIHFSINLKDLQVYALELNPIELEAIKTLRKQISTLKPYELGYLQFILFRYFHSKNFDVGENNLIIPWDGKNNSFADQIKKNYKFEKTLSPNINKIQTQRGLQKLWATYLLFSGHEEQLFPPRIFTLEQAEKFLTVTMDYLRIFNFETNITLKKNQITDALSPAQRAGHTINQIVKDGIDLFGDYGRKYTRIICSYFLHTTGFDWNAKKEIIKWDGKTNTRVEEVSGNFAGSDVRDFLLPKLQKYFGEAKEEELQNIASACDRAGCE